MAIRPPSRRGAALVGLSLALSILLAGAWSPSAVGSSPLTTLVSVASDGTQADFPSANPSTSADGRFVAFDTSAANLVPDDTNAFGDVFVRDRQAGETTRVSLASDGTQANEGSALPAISATGRFVAFVSGATNLVPGDTNPLVDAFVHDRQTGQTTRVNVASDGTQAGGIGASYGSAKPSISADGRYVAFDTDASNLVPGDTNTCASVPNIPPGACPDVFVNDQSFRPAISADGRYVAFASLASNLVSGDTNGVLDIFVHDRQTGETTRVSVASDGTEGNRDSAFPSVSADGRYVAFVSDASNLVPGDTNGRRAAYLGEDIFVHDRQTGQTTRVSVAFNQRQARGPSLQPSISASGRFVAFTSAASNLVPGDTNRILDVFVRDRQTETTVRASVASDGTQATGDAGLFDSSIDPSISADGRSVAFTSSTTNLVPGDANRVNDVFARELAP